MRRYSDSDSNGSPEGHGVRLAARGRRSSSGLGGTAAAMPPPAHHPPPADMHPANSGLLCKMGLCK